MGMVNILPTAEDMLPKRKTLTKNEAAVKAHAILDMHQLEDILKEVAVNYKITGKERSEAIKGKFRVRSLVERFTLKDCLGKVTPEIWTSMGKAALDGMFKNINMAQNNGIWKVLEIEVATRPDADGEQHILFGVRWVDARNQPDLAYKDGVPAVNVSVNSTLPDDLLELLRTQASKDTGGDPELKELIKLLAAKLLQDDKPPQSEAPVPEYGEQKEQQ